MPPTTDPLGPRQLDGAGDWRALGESLRDRLVSDDEAARARRRIAHLFGKVPSSLAAAEQLERARRAVARQAMRAEAARPTGPVSVQETSANRKLGPVELIDHGGPRPSPRGAWPFVSSTYVSIEATCPDSCAFKGAGCYVEAGFTGGRARQLDRAARRLTAAQVIEREVEALEQAFGGGCIPQDGARGGRDLRLHVGGDAGNEEGARRLAWAADRWRRRGGGAVWTFTHLWRSIAREAWGAVSVLASCDTPEELGEAARAGYAPVLVVLRFPGRRAFSVPGWPGKLVPCPAEVGKTTCVECRLCLDAPGLLERGRGIAFAAHGPQADVAVSRLVRR